MNGFVIALSLLAASTFVNAGELFPGGGRLPRPFALADKLENDATIGGYPIWSGEGKWRLYELIRNDSSRGDPMGTARMFQTENKKLVTGMEVYANLSGGDTYWTDEPCKRDDMLFKKQFASGREDNCVTINHITHFMENPGGKAIELYAMFKEQGIEVPKTVLQINLTRNGTSSKRLVYSIYVNPEVVGFASENEYNWSRNPWNKTMAFNDPAKKQFIDGLTTWALSFAKQMDEGLKKKQDAFSNIPSWRAGADVKVKSEEVKSTTTLD